MEIGPALAILAAIVVVATALGFVLRSRDGRVTTAPSGTRVDASDIGLERLADRATLVQFSTETCARCPGARRLLSAIAAADDGVGYTDVDLTHRHDLAARYGVMHTPTTLIVDRAGTIAARIIGTPNPTAVREQLAAVGKEAHVSSGRN